LATFVERKLSTSSATLSRLIVFRAGAEVCGIVDFAADLLIGFVSKATRLISIKWIGETLSDVTLPPHDPQPSVIEGARSVERPMAPWVVGEFITTLDAGMALPYSMAFCRSCVCIPAV